MDQNEARNIAINLREEPTQETPKPRVNLFQPNEQQSTPYKDLMNTAQPQSSYTDHYEQYGHPKNFEHAGESMLHHERTLSLINRYNEGQISYEDMLMQARGYDILAAEGHDVRNPAYWFKRFKNMEYHDITKNQHTMSYVLAKAEESLRLNYLDNLMYTENTLFNEVIGNRQATDETMSKAFGTTWEEVKTQFDEDYTKALEYLRSSAAQIDRFSPDMQWYIHTDGRIYRVTDDQSDTRSDAARITYNEDGTLSRLVINNNEVTGNTLLDGLLSGSTGFLVTMVQTLGSLPLGAIDLAESAVQGQAPSFDRLMNFQMEMESMRSNNPFTAKARVDLDGFNFRDVDDWADMVGDFAGLVLGMKMTGFLGAKGLVATQGKTGVLAKTTNLGSRVLANASQIHSGGISKKIGGWSGRAIFASIHATKDGLSVYRNRRLAGDTEQEAQRKARTIMGINTAITFAIGSGAKDDTYHLYSALASGKLSFVKKAATSGHITSAVRAGMVTSGLDFFDNFLTMSLAQQMESGQDLSVAKAFSEGDFRTFFYAAAMASNAYRGAQRYNNIDVPREVNQMVIDRTMNQVRERTNNTTGAEKQKAILFEKELSKTIQQEMQREGATLDSVLETLHNKLKKENGYSQISNNFKDVTNEELIRHSREIYKAAMKENQKKADVLTRHVFRSLLDEGVTGYVQKILRKEGIHTREFTRNYNHAMASWGKELMTSERWSSIYTDDVRKNVEATHRVREFIQPVHDPRSGVTNGYDEARGAYVFEIKNPGNEAQTSSEFIATRLFMEAMAGERGHEYFTVDENGRYYFQATAGITDMVRLTEAFHTALDVLKTIHSGRLSLDEQAEQVLKLAPAVFPTGAVQGRHRGDQTLDILDAAIKMKYVTPAQAIKIIDAIPAKEFTQDGRQTSALYKAKEIVAEISKGKTPNIEDADSETINVAAAALDVKGKQGLLEVMERQRSPFRKKTMDYLLEQPNEEVRNVHKVLQDEIQKIAHVSNKELFKVEDEAEKILRKAGLMRGNQLKVTDREAIAYLVKEHPTVFKDEYFNKFFASTVADAWEFIENKTTTGKQLPGRIRLKIGGTNGIKIKAHRIMERVINQWNPKISLTSEKVIAELRRQGVSPNEINRELRGLTRLITTEGAKGFIDIEPGTQRGQAILRTLGYEEGDLAYIHEGITMGDQSQRLIPLKEINPRPEAKIHRLGISETIADPIDQAEPGFITPNTRMSPTQTVPLGRPTGRTVISRGIDFIHIVKKKLATAGSKGETYTEYERIKEYQELEHDPKLLNTAALLEIERLFVDDVSEQGRPGGTVMPTHRPDGTPTRAGLQKYWQNVTTGVYEGKKGYLVSGLKRTASGESVMLRNIRNGSFKMEEFAVFDSDYYGNYEDTVIALRNIRGQAVTGVHTRTNVGRNLFTMLDTLSDEVKQYLVNEGRGEFFDGRELDYYGEFTSPIRLGNRVTAKEQIEYLQNKKNLNMAEELYLKALEFNLREDATTEQKMLSDIPLLRFMKENALKSDLDQRIRTYLRTRAATEDAGIEYGTSVRYLHEYDTEEINHILARSKELLERIERSSDYTDLVAVNPDDEVTLRAHNLITNNTLSLKDLAMADEETRHALVTKVLKDKDDIALVKELIEKLDTAIGKPQKQTEQILGVRAPIESDGHPSLLVRTGQSFTGKQVTVDEYLKNNLEAKNEKARRLNLLTNEVATEQFKNTLVDDRGIIPNPHHRVAYEIERQQFISRHSSTIGEAQARALWDKLKGEDVISYVFLDKKGEVIDDLTVYGNRDEALSEIFMMQTKNRKLADAVYVASVNDRRVSVFNKSESFVHKLDEVLPTLRYNGKDLQMTVKEFMQLKTARNFEEYFERVKADQPNRDIALRNYLHSTMSRHTQRENIKRNLAEGNLKVVDSLRQIEKMFKENIIDPDSSLITNLDYHLGGLSGEVSPQDVLQNIFNGVDPRQINNTQRSQVNEVHDRLDEQMRSVATEADAEYVEGYVKTYRKNLYNERKKGGVTQPLDKEPWRNLSDSTLKTNQQKQQRFKELALMATLKNSDTANGVRWALDEDYTLQRMFQDKNVVFSPARTITNLIGEKVAVLDLEFIPMKDSVHRISGAVITGRYSKDKNGVIKFHRDRNQATKEFIYKINPTDEIDKKFKEIISTMKNKGEDTRSLEAEYARAIAEEGHDGAEFDQLIQQLNRDGYTFIAHSGTEADFEVLQRSGLTLNKRVDSIPLIAKSRLFTEKITMTSNKMSLLRDHYGIKKTGAHGSYKDTEDLVEVIRNVIKEADEVTYRGSRVMEEVDGALKAAGLSELKMMDMEKISGSIDALKKGNKHSFEEMMGLERNVESLIKIQRMKAYNDHIANRTTPIMNAKEDLMRGRTLAAETINRINEKGVSHLNRIASYAVSTSRPMDDGASKFAIGRDLATKIKNAIERRYKAETGEGYIPQRELVNRMFDPDTFTDEMIDEIFGGNVHNRVRGHQVDGEAIRIFSEDTPEMRELQEGIALGDYNRKNAPMNMLFNLISENLGEEMLPYLRYKEMATVANEMGDIEIIETVSPARRQHNKRYSSAVNTAIDHLLEDFVVKQKIRESTYGAAVMMVYGKTHEIRTAQGVETRTLRADEVGITREEALNMFDAERIDQDPDNLYGYVLRQPSDNPGSRHPVQFRIVNDPLGRGYIIDDNLMYSLQGDFDGDKLAMFGAREGAQTALIRQLSAMYNRPFVELRERVEGEYIAKGITYKNESKAFEVYNKMLSDPEFTKRITAFKNPTQAINGIKKWMSENGFRYDDAQMTKDAEVILENRIRSSIMSGKAEVDLGKRFEFLDQAQGMIHKDWTGVADNYREFYNTINETNILRRLNRRGLIASSTTERMMQELGMDAGKVFHEIDQRFLAQLEDRRNNQLTYELIMDPEVQETSRVSETISRINDLINEKDLSPIFIAAKDDITPRGVHDALEEIIGLRPGEVKDFKIVKQADIPSQVSGVRVGMSEGVPDDTIIVNPKWLAQQIGVRATTYERQPHQQLTRFAVEKVEGRVGTIDEMELAMVRMIQAGMRNFQRIHPDEFLNVNVNYRTMGPGLRETLEVLKEAYGLSGKDFDDAMKRANDALPKDIQKFPFAEETIAELVMLAGMWGRDGEVDLDSKFTSVLSDKQIITMLSRMGSLGQRLGKGLGFLEEVVEKMNFAEGDKQAFRGMPLFRDGDGYVYANSNGEIEIDRNGNVIIRESGPMDPAGLKMTTLRSGAGKGTVSIQFMDNDDFDILIGSEAFNKKHKASPAQIAEARPERYDGEIKVGNTTYSNPLKLVTDVQLLENINLDPVKKKTGSTSLFKNTLGQSLDLTTWLANLNSALGVAEYTPDSVNRIISTLESLERQVNGQTDRSHDFAMLRVMTALSLLTPEQRANIGFRGDFTDYRDIDENLPSIERAIKREVGEGMEYFVRKIEEKFKSDRPDANRDRAVKAAKNLFLTDLTELYPSREEALYDEGFITSKSSPGKANSSFTSRTGRTSLQEETQTGNESSRLKYMDSTKFYEILDMDYHYDPYKAFQLTQLGYLPIAKETKGGVASGFRSQDGEIVRGTEHIIDPQGTAKAGEGIPRGHEIIRHLEEFDYKKRANDTVREGRPEELPGYSQLKASKFADRQVDTTQNALRATSRMHNEQGDKLGAFADLLMRDIPTKTHDAYEYKYIGANIGVRDGEVDTLPMKTTSEITVDRGNVKMSTPQELYKATQYSNLLDVNRLQTELRQPDPTNIERVQLPKIDTESFDRQLAEDNEMMRVMDFPENDFTTPLKKAFIREHTYANNDLVNKGFKKSLFSSGGIQRVSRGKGDADAYVADQIAARFNKNVNYFLGTMRQPLNRLHAALNNAGRQAQADFETFYMLDAVRHWRAVHGQEFSPDTLRALQNLTGAQDVEGIMRFADEFVENYAYANREIAREVDNAAEYLMELARETSVLNDEPGLNTFFVMFPALVENHKSRTDMFFEPQKYNQMNNLTEVFKKELGVNPILSLDELAKDLAMIKGHQIMAEDLKSNGIIHNDKAVQDAFDYVRDQYNRLAEHDKETIHRRNTRIGEEITIAAGSKGFIFKKMYEDARTGGKSDFEASLDAVKKFKEYEMQKVLEVIRKKEPELAKHVDSFEGVHRILKLTDDLDIVEVVRDLEFAYLAEIEVFENVTRHIDRNGYRDYVASKRGTNFNLTDEAGRLIKQYGAIKPLPSETSLEYLSQNLKMSEYHLLENALRGRVFYGNKTFTDHLDKDYYNRPMPKGVKRTLRKAGQMGTKYIMGNPINLLSRMERFTFTDTMMGSMANKRTVLYLPRARKELAQSLATNGKVATDEVRAYQRERGSIVGTDRDKDWYQRQDETGFKQFANKKNVFGQAWNFSLDQLNMQHDLVRYAIFLATLDDIKKHGDIKSWGSAYAHRDGINRLGSDEARAARVAFHNIATFGDMPYGIRYLTPWLVFTSYLAGQVRWAGDWGLSMKAAASKAMSGEDTRQALGHLATPGIGLGAMYLLGNMIYSAIGSMFNVDEEDVDKWREERNYIELFTTLGTGAPVANQASGMPIEQLYKEFFETIQKGMEANGVPGAVGAMFNKQIAARANPLIKIPIESVTGKMYFSEFPIEDRYHGNFIENILRKVSGTFVGIQSVNSIMDQRMLSQYREEEMPMLYDIRKGFTNAISSEFGNTKKYKRDLADFYRIRRVIYDEIFRDQGTSEDMTSTRTFETTVNYSNTSFDRDMANEITNKFRTVMRREEDVSHIYGIVQEALNDGASPATVHAALNRISVVRLMNRLDDPDAFVAGLSEREQEAFRNALAFEREMFPGIHQINLYENNGRSNTGWVRNYIPYNNANYLPWRSSFRPWQPQYDPAIYPSMGGHYDRNELGGFYQRWQPRSERYE